MLISTCGGNASGFSQEHEGRNGVFQENAKYDKENAIWKGGGGTRENTNALTSNQVYEVIKERSDLWNTTRRDAAELKEDINAHRAAKVEGILALVEESNVELEYLSSLVDMTKLKVYYLEYLIFYKYQIPEKGPKAVQVDQLKKLLDSDPFHLFSPHLNMR